VFTKAQHLYLFFSQINPFHGFPFNVSNFHFNIIVPSSPNGLLPSAPTTKTLYLFIFSSTRMVHASTILSSLFDHPSRFLCKNNEAPHYEFFSSILLLSPSWTKVCLFRTLKSSNNINNNNNLKL